MNERMAELALQAGSTGVKQVWFTRPELEKFAQLIVQECMEQVWYTREDSIDGNISDVIKERMKEHFGVEE